MPSLPDARETRAFPSEIKFVVDATVGMRIRDWARHHLDPDPHGIGPFRDAYHTSSLYFDTRCFDVFHRRGSFGRCKYRIRRYGGADVVFLERKLRKPGLLIKRRTAGTLQALDRLRHTTPQHGWSGNWFHRRLLVRRLRPVCQLSYHRTARAIINGGGPARLTIDDDIRAAATEQLRFGSDAGAPVLEGLVIVELKYRIQLPAIFKRLVEEFALRTQTASKYRLGMMALGHVTASDEPPVLSGDSAYA